MIKHSLMVIALGLTMNAPWALAESHVDTHVADADSGLIPGWKEVFAGEEREVEIARRQMKASFAWRGESYFPENALGPEGSFGDMITQSFSDFLRRMDEPILYNKHMDKGEVTIRLTILPAFGLPFVFRAHSSGPDNAQTFILSHSVGFGPFKYAPAREISLDHPAFAQILDRAFETRACEDAHDERMGSDGSSWAIEVKTADRYCADSVWTPVAGPWQDLAQEVFQYVEGDEKVFFAKRLIEMSLSETE